MYKNNPAYPFAAHHPGNRSLYQTEIFIEELSKEDIWDEKELFILNEHRPETVFAFMYIMVDSDYDWSGFPKKYMPVGESDWKLAQISMLRALLYYLKVEDNFREIPRLFREHLLGELASFFKHSMFPCWFVATLGEMMSRVSIGERLGKWLKDEVWEEASEARAVENMFLKLLSLGVFEEWYRSIHFHDEIPEGMVEFIRHTFPANDPEAV